MKNLSATRSFSTAPQRQISLFEKKEEIEDIRDEIDYQARLLKFLSGDLDFHNSDSSYSTHNFHAFPAKFSPQLPARFITELTKRSEVVLDPMMGSGTTILEAFLTGRKAIGFDIDPLAMRITKVKTSCFQKGGLKEHARKIISEAKSSSEKNRDDLEKKLADNFDTNTQDLIKYWFSHETALELSALSEAIKQIADDAIRNFFEVLFSSVIVTKSGGVSLAFDLAHTRPHRAKAAYGKEGQLLFGDQTMINTNARSAVFTKKYKSPIDEFARKFNQTLPGLIDSAFNGVRPDINFGNAQSLPLGDSCVDLIVTSPPYASNAIDYMRAHKFSLIWSGYSIDQLSMMRKNYIGAELTTNFQFASLPEYTRLIVDKVLKQDIKKGRSLHRYYSEMVRTLREMRRVLKPGRAAIVVVGNSILKGIDTETHICLADIGEHIGFRLVKIGVRQLDRNKRMMPTAHKTDKSSQIQQRMHEEYVIGFFKPWTERNLSWQPSITKTMVSSEELPKNF